MQSAKVILNFMLSFQNLRRPSLLLKYLVIAAVPFFTWAQDGPNREQGIRPMHVQKNTEMFASGGLKAEYRFYRGKDGLEVLHGKYITWLESGHKYSEQNYQNGKAEGRTTYWHENGKASWQGMYHNDYPVGEWVSWDESGRKKSSCHYANGQKEGVCLWWDAQGRRADAVEYIHGKPRAIAEWEARDQREVKTPIYLYPFILISPNGSLTFTSEYAGITKEFSLSQLQEIFTSLPSSVWVDGKSIGVQQIGIASEADHQTMDQVMEKLKAFFAGKGYRVSGLTN
jgi:hypothetical protein